VIDYLKEENRLLKEKLGGQKLHFSDTERRRLATRAQALGRKVLLQLDTLVTPDTLLRWHRQLIAQKWNYVHRRGVGRPRTKDQIVALLLRMVNENSSWGYTQVQGALKNVGYKVGRSTIANILRVNGIDPAPLRGKRTTWSSFLKAHWKILLASDFFTVEVWRLHGLTTYYVLFFIELKTRMVTIAGVTTNPNTTWMMQMGRNVLDSEAGLLKVGRKLIIDRDTKYCGEFRRLIADAGCEVIRLPPRAPNLNAYAERFVGSIKSECLNRLIFIGEASLRRSIRHYVLHYHEERSHQGLGNTLIAANDPHIGMAGSIERKERLGGMLSYYYRGAA
jgi:putative transposase